MEFLIKYSPEICFLMGLYFSKEMFESNSAKKVKTTTPVEETEYKNMYL